MGKASTSAEIALQAAARGRLPQTVLLAGEEGCGKMALATRLAAALLCTAQGQKPCETCNACHKVREGIHPDLTIVDEETRELKIELARSIRSSVSVLPNDGERRVIIIRHAHRLNLPAQNALLKTLEEPPRYAFFILTSEMPDVLLPTILSRCTRYDLAPSMQPFTEESLVSVLVPIFSALAAGEEFSLLQACMALEKLSRAAQKALLLLCQTALRDTLFVAHALPGRLLPAMEAQTSALARSISPDRLLRLSSWITTLAGRLDFNAASAATSSALCAGAYQICYL